MLGGGGGGKSEAALRKPDRRMCSIFVTPPPYPGYTSYLGSIQRRRNGEAMFCPYGESIADQLEDSPITDYDPSTTPDEESFTAISGRHSPPLASPENDSEYQLETELPSKKTSQVASASSGYGSSSASGESDQEISEQVSLKGSVQYGSSLSRVGRKDRQIDRWRRRTCPVSLQKVFDEDVMRILQKDGHVVLVETDVDTGRPVSMETRGARRPETVMQLARRFGEIGAAQQNDVHRSRNSLLDGKENARNVGQSKSGPCTPVKTAYQVSERTLGGIASLRCDTPQQKMAARTNIFKQMEKVSSTTASPRTMNPNSIKDALLRWVQNRVQGYPNVSVTNFSSSWADGMAFCALIHRFAPDAFDFNKLDPKNRRQNFELAFRVAEEHGICPLLEVDDMIMMGDRPDWKCVFTYVQCFYKQFREHP
uniref:Calponin-homology (CH) domain-containing protein n=1 Tax=Haemonchus contortus TaxID=6289 RepID=A0A7I4YAK3_HAECO